MSPNFLKKTPSRIAAMIFSVLANVAFLAPASAQVPAIEIAVDKDWQHDWTPMVFPAQIDSFQRQTINQFEERDTNIASQYYDEETKTHLSIYIYRPGNPNSAIWFDRALMSIGARDIYGDVDLEEMKVGSFVPNGGTVESGQYAVIKPSGRFRSTAVSLYQAGEWLVKLRISSRELRVGPMETLLQSINGALPALENISRTPAYFVKLCETPMSTKAAAEIEADSGMSVALGLSFVTGNETEVQDQLADANGAPDGQSPRQYCRFGEREPSFNVYRPGETSNQYYVATGDSGFGVMVAPDPLLGLLSGDEAKVHRITVSTSSGLITQILGVFDATPNLDQTIQAVNNGRVIATINRTLGDEGQFICVSSGTVTAECDSSSEFESSDD